MGECNEHKCVGDEMCIAKQDLILAVDGSGSVRENGFNILKSFALNLFTKYKNEYFGGEAMKVGIVEFGNGVIADDGVTVSPAMNVHPLSTDFEAVKGSIEGMVQKKGFTN